MKEKVKFLKPIPNMMAMSLLVLLFILTTQTSAVAQPLCDGKVPTIIGTEDPDIIDGTDGPDVIHGLGGADVIQGLGGDDVICGGSGSDVIGAGSGNDIVLGGPGHDAIWGGPGDDILRGGDGNDTIFGGSSGNDILYGDDGNDYLHGKSGVDQLYGGGGIENNDTCRDGGISTVHLGCEQFNGQYVPPAPVPKTGQTKRYEDGDDGDLEKGVKWPVTRFTDNGDGTVTDNLTGLIWLKNADCFVGQVWYKALRASNELADGQCGLSDGSSPGDWRLPNVRELFSLSDLSKHEPALPDGHPFVGMAASEYWSSTTLVHDFPGWIFTVNMTPGAPQVKQRDTCICKVWPVRGGN